MISSIEISHALEDEVFLHYFFSHFIHLHLMGLTLVLTIALNDLMISGAKKDHPFYRSWHNKKFFTFFVVIHKIVADPIAQCFMFNFSELIFSVLKFIAYKCTVFFLVIFSVAMCIWKSNCSDLFIYGAQCLSCAQASSSF